MRIDLFALLAKFPLASALLCLALSCYTGPKVLREARFEGFLPSDSLKAEVVETYTQEGIGRRLRTKTDCYVKVKLEGRTYDKKMDCEDMQNYETGSEIELVNDAGRYETLSIMKGHFYFDLFLLMAEIFGAYYYFRLSRRGVVELS